MYYKVCKLQGFESPGSILVPSPLPSPLSSLPSTAHYEYEYRDYCTAMPAMPAMPGHQEVSPKYLTKTTIHYVSNKNPARSE